MVCRIGGTIIKDNKQNQMEFTAYYRVMNRKQWYFCDDLGVLQARAEMLSGPPRMEKI